MESTSLISKHDQQLKTNKAFLKRIHNYNKENNHTNSMLINKQQFFEIKNRQINRLIEKLRYIETMEKINNASELCEIVKITSEYVGKNHVSANNKNKLKKHAIRKIYQLFIKNT